MITQTFQLHGRICVWLVTFLYAAGNRDPFLNLCGKVSCIIIFHNLYSHSHSLIFMCLRAESHANISEHWRNFKTLFVFRGAFSCAAPLLWGGKCPWLWNILQDKCWQWKLIQGNSPEQSLPCQAAGKCNTFLFHFAAFVPLHDQMRAAHSKVKLVLPLSTGF